jgi:exonuclease V gamma subunit
MGLGPPMIGEMFGGYCPIYTSASHVDGRTREAYIVSLGTNLILTESNGSRHQLLALADVIFIVIVYCSRFYGIVCFT